MLLVSEAVYIPKMKKKNPKKPKEFIYDLQRLIIPGLDRYHIA